MALRAKKPKISKVAIVVGEASGDILGEGLVRQLKRSYPNVHCYGIGGPLMISEGFDSLFPMERLSVMGLVEVLGRVWELIKIRKQLKRRFLQDKPDVFIGIDSSDFNLALARDLKEAGIPAIQYVSPKVWAWREGRVKKIRKAVDNMLVLLPFEEQYFRKYEVMATFVGHPLADQIPLISPDKALAKKHLDIPSNALVVALLPGSRKKEIDYLGDILLQTAVLLQKQHYGIRFLVPCINDKRREQLEKIIARYPSVYVTLYDGRSQEIMAASDVVLMASGTASLEAALCKKPIVVCYRMNKITYAILKLMASVKYVSLPNLLADKALIPELLQEKATPKLLCKAVEKALSDRDYQDELTKEFTIMHKSLKKDADHLVVNAVKSTIQRVKDAKRV